MSRRSAYLQNGSAAGRLLTCGDFSIRDRSFKGRFGIEDATVEGVGSSGAEHNHVILQVHLVRIAHNQHRSVLHFDLHDRYIFSLACRRAILLFFKLISAAVRNDDVVKYLHPGEPGMVTYERDVLARQVLRIHVVVLRHLLQKLVEKNLLPNVLSLLIDFMIGADHVGIRDDVTVGIDKEARAQTDVGDVVCFATLPVGRCVIKGSCHAIVIRTTDGLLNIASAHRR